MNTKLVSLFAILAGFLLGLMVYLNGILANYINPIPASLLIHLVGSLAAIVLLAIKSKSLIKDSKSFKFNWTYCVGLFGAIAVVVIGYTVNSPLGVAGTIGSLVLGQIIYGWLNDYFGFFGSVKRKLYIYDFLQAVFILAGVSVIIYG